MPEALDAALRLTLTPRLGRAAQRKLLRRFEVPTAALAATAGEWQETLEDARGGELLASARGADTTARARETLRRCSQLGVKLLPLEDPAYPKLLRAIPDPPPLLYLLGEPPPGEERRVAVVGTRKATSQGLAFTNRVASELALAGGVIVSGLALGIDSQAHRALVEAEGKGIAVLANGLETVHPYAHLGLARSLLARGGCLLSENPPGAAVQRWHFLSRNRIISGLANVLLVVEAGLRSGAMKTAEFALEQGRTVLAMPGRPGDPVMAGCLQLLREGAIPATCPEDVLEEMNLRPVSVGRPRLVELGSAAALLDGSSASFEELRVASGRSPSQLLAILGRLELEGRLVRNAAGDYYQPG